MRAAAALALLAGCAAATAPAPEGPGAPAAGGSRPAPSRPAGAPASAAWYGPERELTPTRDEEVVLAAVRARHGALARSPALSRAARELALRAASGEPEAAGHAAVAGALARAAALDPAPSVFTAAGRPDRAAPGLAAALVRGEFTHYGVGVARAAGATRVVLLAARRLVRLERFPRDVEPGAAADLRGRLSGLAEPRAWATGPDGRVREVALHGDPAFSGRIAFDLPGRWAVEVLGRGPTGPQVAAMLVVSCGGAPLDPPPRPPAGPDPEDAGAAEERVLAAVNALRQRRGLPPLDPSERLRDAARRHSADMLAAGALAHVLPGSGAVDQRLRRAGIPFRRALENLALGPTAGAAQESIEESPAHLGSLLSPEVDQIGVGIARGRLEPGGGPVVYLTQILVQRVDDSSDSRLRPEARVKEALWRERQRLGRAPLLADDRLDELAARAARAMLRSDEPAPGALADEALALGRKSAGADAFVVASPDDAAHSTNLPDARFRRVGVGVAIGDSPRFGSGLLWIAVVYTD
jgi:uncharacterized protein YkwD